MILPGSERSILFDLDLEARRGPLEVILRVTPDAGPPQRILLRLTCEDALRLDGTDSCCRVEGPPGSTLDAGRFSVSWLSSERCPLRAECDLDFVRARPVHESPVAMEFAVDLQVGSPVGERGGNVTIRNAETGKTVLKFPILVRVAGAAPGSAAPAPRADLRQPRAGETRIEFQRRLLALLSTINDSPAGPAWFGLAESPELTSEERAVVIRALGHSGAFEAQMMLARLAQKPDLERPEEDALRGAFRAVAERDLRWAEDGYALARDQGLRARYLRAITESGAPGGIAVAERAFHSEEAPVRESILSSLVAYPDPSALAFLRQVALESISGQEALLAVRGLCRIPGEAAVTVLKEISTSESSGREYAILELQGR